MVEKGIPAVDEAVSKNDASILVEYLLTVPFRPNPQAIAYREERRDKLIAMDAPQVIIRNEEYFLGRVNGEAYTREKLSTMTLDELREELGGWGRESDSFELDRAWGDLDWFLQPAEVADNLLMSPSRPSVGDPSQTLLDQALIGGQPSPLDGTGSPIIRSLMPSEAGESLGYNPPETTQRMLDALMAVDVESWDEFVPTRVAQYDNSSENWGDTAEIVATELENAKMALSVTREAYRAAIERDFGVGCEFVL